MKKLIALAIILAFVLSAIGVYAGLTAPGYDSKPADGTVLTSTSVNFSFRINNTNNAATLFEYRILNTSSRAQALAGNYSVLITGNITNGSFFNITQTMVDQLRHYFIINFSNATTNGLVTSRSVFNIDVNYYKQIFGSQERINFTLDKGDINISGNLHIGAGGNITMIQGDTRYLCGPNGTGKPMICV